MTLPVDAFYGSIKGVEKLTQSDLIGYFVYYLTMENEQSVATTTAIENCFQACDLAIPKNTSARLSSSLSGRSARYVKFPKGYRLHRAHREKIEANLGFIGRGNLIQTSKLLQGLEEKLNSDAEKVFLKEVTDCFSIGANRATVIMCWVLTINHLYDFVWRHYRAAFDKVLSQNTDRRIKLTKVDSRDDFGDIPEKKFIEFLRSAGIISNDVRKILDEKLGIRNSAAHPSSVSVKPSKVVEFVDDLIENVILKYSI